MMLGADYLSALIVGIADLALCWLIMRFVNSAFAGEPISARLAAGLVLFWAMIAGAGIALGMAKLLTPFALYVSVFAITMLLRYLPSSKRAQLDKIDSDKRPSLVSVEPQPAWPARLAFGALAALWLAHLVVNGLLELPADWDTLAYHLPIVDHWIQYQHLYSQDCAFWYVPGNNELLTYWLVAPFSGDFWASLTNVVPILLLATSSLALGRSLNLSPAVRFTALALLLANQAVLRQIISTENDVAVTALFLAAIYFSWRWIDRKETRDLSLFACAVGLLAGVKYYALGYASVASALPVVWLCLRREYARIARLALFAALGLICFGLFWYARNWLLTGTPLYPLGLFGLPNQWETMRPDSHTSTLLWSGRTKVWPLLFWAWLTNAGPVTTAIVVISPLVCLVLLLHSRDETSRRWLCVLLGVGLVYLVTPNVVETQSGSFNMLASGYHPVRFGLTFLACAVLGFGLLTTRCLASLTGRWRARAEMAAKILMVLAIAVQGLWHLLPLVGAEEWHARWGIKLYQGELRQGLHLEYLLAAVNLFLGIAIWPREARWPRYARGMAVALVLVAFVAASGLLASRWHSHFDRHFAQVLRTEIYRDAAAQTTPDDRLCVCDSRYYPALGSRRERSVCRPLWPATRQEFQSYLIRHGATYVMARYGRPTGDAYGQVRHWLSEDPAHFELVSEDGRFALYRIRASEIPP